MDIRNNIWFGASLLLSLVGTLFAIIAFREWRTTGRIIKTGVQTTGVVIENVKRPRRAGESFQSTAMAPGVLFVTNKGEQFTYYSQTYTTPASYSIGDKVDIWYLPEEPNKATLKGADAWILPVAFGIFGLAMCLIGYPSFLSQLKDRVLH